MDVYCSVAINPNDVLSALDWVMYILILRVLLLDPVRKDILDCEHILFLGATFTLMFK